MSLFLDLRVTLTPRVSESVGFMQVRRTEPLPAGNADDAVCAYEVRVDRELRGVVRHRYGDGPWALLAKAVDLHLSASSGRRGLND